MLAKLTVLTQKIEYLALRSNGIYWLASQYYEPVIRQEIELADLTEEDRVLFIGGGACPFTAIQIQQLTNARVTVVDSHAGCAASCSGFIKKLGLEKKIKTICRDGLDPALDLSSYSVIHLALQVTPLEPLVERIKKSADKKTRLLIRHPKKALSSMYCPYRAALNKWGGAAAVVHKKRNIAYTTLHIRGDKNEKNNAFGITGCSNDFDVFSPGMGSVLG